ncbi:DJ-1/PfpI family protein [Rhodospirillaceae bacterium KN72]|uniref:DJ-1/PfpI family protein n=1 Tax=Pacificispira spongiicola TaxID=2729598 RepID=A0A7Y0E237_9PROT|nr:DJ-1/PfpI family protein [Pacificispira spongiicola]NMM45809.1 DJ-1/PfpI family protein [Pacificispira spongiicola]
MSVTYGILLFEDFEELDAIGPWEVFGMAAEEKPGDRLICISRDGQPVRARKGLRVIPDYSFANCPPLDVLLVPGGDGSKLLVDDKEVLSWIAERGAAATWATSVCTGARLMIKSGLAKGKRVTTHWSAIDPIRSWGETDVLSGPRFVRDGKLVTAAGVSAGIDMALWIVGQLYDPDFARTVQHEMEYNPAPPYTAEI